MNYLAHLSLSNNDPATMMGNFIADDISHRELKELPSNIMKGVELHRLIDNYTDDHPAFRSSVEVFRSNHGKYATVIVDIINDHFLTLNWQSFIQTPFDSFEGKVYSSFEMLNGQVPPSANRHVTALLDHRYLKVYQTKEGMKGVMKRMDKRTRFKSDFLSTVDEAYDQIKILNHNFVELYTDLQRELTSMWLSLSPDQPSK